MLGTFFYPEYFSKITNSNVREPLMRMSEEINQDLDAFEKVLKEYGAQVIRAEQPTGYFDELNPYTAPLQVRNTHAVAGDTMYQFNADWYNPIDPILRKYCSNVVNLLEDNNSFYQTNMSNAADCYNSTLDILYSRAKYSELAGSDWPSFDNYINGDRSSNLEIQQELAGFKQVLEYETKELGPLQGPNVINLEDAILVDANEYCDYAKWFAQHKTDGRSVQQFTSKAGHIDGCFAVLGNKTILGISPLIDYDKYFPGYTVVPVPTTSYQDQIHEFKAMKDKVNGAWWLAGEEHNEQFISFVESTLKSWTGYVAESIFDVNVLALDEHTICASNITPEVNERLQKQGIECILVSWRHRFFVDGGLHCITLDLNRD
jgi:hypothetical protein